MFKLIASRKIKTFYGTLYFCRHSWLSYMSYIDIFPEETRYDLFYDDIIVIIL